MKFANRLLHSQKTLFGIIIFLILIFSVVTRVYNLGNPPTTSMDEFYYVPAARAIMSGQTDPNLEHHPPLAKELIGVGLKLSGDIPAGWRMPGVIFGILGLIGVYVLAYCLFKNKVLALLSTFVLSTSSLWLIMSRTAMLDIFVSVFLLLVFIGMLWYMRARSKWSVVFLGIAFGLSLSAKWATLLVLMLIPFLMLPFSQQEGFELKLNNKLFRKFLLDIAVVFGISAVVYLITYIPYFLHTNATSLAGVEAKTFTRHLFLIKKDPNQSPLTAFFWPFIPSNALSAGGYKNDTEISIISMIENPLLLWMFVPSIFLGFKESLKKRDLQLLFLTLALLVLYLPWIILDRPKYFYYMLPIIPLLSISVAYFLVHLWEESRRGKIAVSLYVILLMAYFILGYPLVTGIPVSFSYLYKAFFFWSPFIAKM